MKTEEEIRERIKELRNLKEYVRDENVPMFSVCLYTAAEEMLEWVLEESEE